MLNLSEFFGLFGGWSLLYVLFSLIVAIFTWIRADLIMKKQGKSLNGGFFQFMSVVCSLWIFISMAALYFLDFSRYAISIPVVYIIYRVGGLIYSSQLLKEEDLPTNIDDFVIPNKYLIYSKSFALTFTLLCVCVMAYESYPLINLTIS